MGKSIDTPLMRQYLEVKRQHSDAILFFRMGDFYEMFFDDAVVASQQLELTLTSRDRNKEDAVPMCGVPHHAATGYIHRLLELGHRVAICDQVEDPRLARGLVKRAVTQVVTPGVVLDTDHLDARSNNYLLALVASGDRFGLAALDLSTSEMRATEVDGQDALTDELARLQPKEVILSAESRDALSAVRETVPGAWNVVGAEILGPAAVARPLIEEKIGGAAAATLDEMPQAMQASAAALRYAGATQPAVGIPAVRLVAYRPADHLQLDEATAANLEIFSSLMERRREGSLLWAVDETLTAMGARTLRQWLERPLLDVASIRRRLDAVELLVEQPTPRRSLRDALRPIYDLERLTTRTVMQVVTPRELSRLARSLRQLPQLGQLLRQCAAATIDGDLPELLHVPEDTLAEVAEMIDHALVDDPPHLAREGGVIRPGHNAELDEVVCLSEGGKSEILAIESRERERTGITSLKVRYNRVFGYYIEVTRSNLKSVPADYQRKQTLANAERFITVELADYEAKVLGAEERRVALELELFEELRRRVAQHASRISAAARWIAALDALASLAEVAQLHGFTRPEVDDGEVISIEEGRHPVVERFLPAGQFVPNDLTLDPAAGRMLILTGPNMAGKSTVMRQTALITLLAQAGAFVPARRCRVGVVDRIFTRVGASDNLARGESTFMVEMREMASILQHATARSLVVIDEIGRGTATYDGISIAWAVAEHLHDRVRAKCLFATHYHELCALSDVKPFVRNLTIAVQEWKGSVVFLRKLVPGGSSRSYGIEVARLAGLERTVVARARRVLAALESGEVLEGVPIRGAGQGSPQLGLFASARPAAAVDEREAQLLEELCGLDTDHMTPLEALGRLAALVAKATAAKN
jgi:DNA mismatch repair protein MutS